MLKNFNLQFLISYIGFLPYLLVIIDKFFLYQIDISILENFTVLYSIIILVFIGSINWNLKENISKKLVLYGFLPSFFAVIIIIIHLYDFNVFFLLTSLFLIQLICDYFIIFKNENNNKAFYYVRIPLTALIIISLTIIQ
tara:strand:- start:5350 stop:5769 length:420 start_codon:yes stop_codon:yes gene_type:complete